MAEQHGELQWVKLDTSKGLVGVLFEVHIKGKTLHLKDVTIFAPQEKPLRGILKDILRFRSQAVDYARALGFVRLRITGHRSLKSSSVNPGKNIDIDIKL